MFVKNNVYQYSMTEMKNHCHRMVHIMVYTLEKCTDALSSSSYDESRRSIPIFSLACIFSI